MTETTAGNKNLRMGLIMLIAALAFVASYQIALAAGDNSAAGTTGGGGTLFAAAPGSPSCACCGNQGSGEQIEGTATVEGDVQRITVDASAGYNPNVIKLAAGIPAEITFTQGSGCMAQVMSKDFGFFEDLTTGPKTVRIEGDALQVGEYGFSCGMQMVFGTIIVE